MSHERRSGATIVIVQFTVHGQPVTQGIVLKEGVAEPDWSRILTLLRGLIGEQADPHRIKIIVHDGAPCSKARPRFANGRAYTPEGTVSAQRALAAKFQDHDREESNVAIVAIFFRSNRQRIDADNMMKLVMDACTDAGLWHDDCQVTAQASIVELDAKRPRTVVAWCPIESTLDRSYQHVRACVICAKEFRVQVYRSRIDAKHRSVTCSVGCGNTYRLQMQRKSFDSDAFCKRGHPWKPETTKLRFGKYRVCLLCQKMLGRDAYQKARVKPGFRAARNAANRKYEKARGPRVRSKKNVSAEAPSGLKWPWNENPEEPFVNSMRKKK
jgi:Holliday junction resolvase RusA-like endonuclease